MGGKPIHNYFNQNFIGIGEDHNGDYAFDFYKKQQTDMLLDFLEKKDNIILWFEGPNVAAKSK